MAKWTVTGMVGGTVSDDGSRADLLVTTESGKRHTLSISYDQMRWLAQAALQACGGMYRQQIVAGRLQPDFTGDAAMIAESFSVSTDRQNRRATVQVFGRERTGGPPGLGSVRVDKASDLRELAAKLVQAADELEGSLN